MTSRPTENPTQPDITRHFFRRFIDLLLGLEESQLVGGGQGLRRRAVANRHGGSTGHNICNGNLGNDTLTGGSGGDILRGGQGDDSIVGGAGSDWITGDLGVNTVTGGAGADTFHASAGTDVVTDFSSSQHDRVQVDPGVAYQVSQVDADVQIDLANGGHLILRNIQLADLKSGWLITT